VPSPAKSSSLKNSSRVLWHLWLPLVKLKITATKLKQGLLPSKAQERAPNNQPVELSTLVKDKDKLVHPLVEIQ